MAKLCPRCTQSLNVELHVVAQVVESEFVIGAVSDVGGVSFAAFFVVQVVHDHAYRQAEEAIELAHPLRVALGQVVVDRNHVNAATAERVEIDRQGSDQRFAFAGLHFGDLALVQDHAADQLHVEVTHVENTAAGLANDRESFHQNLVQGFLDGRLARSSSSCLRRSRSASGSSVRSARRVLDASPKFVSLGAQLVVGELLHLLLKGVDGLDVRHQTLQFALVLGPENLA